jgi:hypothetical protein
MMKEGGNVRYTVMIFIVTVIGLSLLSATALADSHDKFMEIAKNELAPIGRDSKIVNWTKAKNSKGETSGQIKRLDGLWKGEEGIADYMKPYLEGDCADYLREVVALVPYLLEIFVMDNQGALVCETDKTGDYMQGDEDKWQKSFAEGMGAVFVDEPEFDKSFGTDILQISVPVMDGGKAIGAITFGVFANKVQ